jgi:hypothetical protein
MVHDGRALCLGEPVLTPCIVHVPPPPSLCRHQVFVHVYYHHFSKMAQIGAEAHVNTCYQHFYFFVKEFDLIPDKELEPLVRRKHVSLPRPLPHSCSLPTRRPTAPWSAFTFFLFGIESFD